LFRSGPVSAGAVTPVRAIRPGASVNSQAIDRIQVGAQPVLDRRKRSQQPVDGTASARHRRQRHRRIAVRPGHVARDAVGIGVERQAQTRARPDLQQGDGPARPALGDPGQAEPQREAPPDLVGLGVAGRQPSDSPSPR
jgi:hypothetical protein